MKRISFHLSKRQWILLFSCLISAVLAIGLHTVSHVLKNQLEHEKVAAQWDKDGDTAQISIYFSEEEKYNLKSSLESTVFQLESWYHGLLTELQNASITADAEAGNSARQVIYGYSASGTVSMETDLGRTEAKAYGVGGDFFQFHPLQLVSGGYFSESDLMQDRVILDTDTAWKLFGSNDIVGMFVQIGGAPHMVVGVYQRESGHFNDAAGNDKSCVYVSHQTLYKYGQYHGLETVEYLIPNPVTGFALGLVEKQCNGRNVALMEHQNRFAVMSLLKILGAFGTRSMGLSGITFPYWENIARGYEDILAGLLLAELIFLAYVAIVLLGWIWYLWLHRKWRVRHIYEKVKDHGYALGVKHHNRKNKKRIKSEKKPKDKPEELRIDTDF
ncbi:MAG: ABC transporter permease [Lachnospiraceae bacterium]|nr:ABC transporter permease [Lachnospiraceae bacterium]